MDLEEHTLEELAGRCEECGAALTDEEMAAALEQGGPALCTTHALEAVELDEEDVPAPRE